MIYVNVRAIIEKKGPNGTEIVIQKRVKSNETQTPYELPGGRLEKFESFIEGLKREVHEETGLQIRSEERRVGKESRYRRGTAQHKKRRQPSDETLTQHTEKIT